MPYADPEQKKANDRAYGEAQKKDPVRGPRRREMQSEHQRRMREDPERKRKDVERTLKWVANNPEKARLLQRRNNLSKYGLTPEAYDALFERQKGCCSICGLKGKPFGSLGAERGEVLSVDHDHQTGAVRELLCFNCNNMLGRARDDETILAAGIAYLRRHR
jgi:hypothetical protein